MNLEYPDSHDLNFSNRLVRTRMPGGVAGARLTPPSMPIKVFNLVSKEYTMKQVTSVGSYEAKTHLPQLLRQVEAGHVVEITVRGRVVARLTSATADQHREVAADKMRQFMRAQQIGGAGANMDLREMINEGRA